MPLTLQLCACCTYPHKPCSSGLCAGSATPRCRSSNLFKNCGYYWAYAAYISYFINHPLYTPPPLPQTLAGLAFAMLCQAANFRCSANRRPGLQGAALPCSAAARLQACAQAPGMLGGTSLASLAKRRSEWLLLLSQHKLRACQHSTLLVSTANLSPATLPAR